MKNKESNVSDIETKANKSEHWRYCIMEKLVWMRLLFLVVVVSLVPPSPSRSVRCSESSFKQQLSGTTTLLRLFASCENDCKPGFARTVFQEGTEQLSVLVRPDETGCEEKVYVVCYPKRWCAELFCVVQGMKGIEPILPTENSLVMGMRGMSRAVPLIGNSARIRCSSLSYQNVLRQMRELLHQWRWTDSAFNKAAVHSKFSRAQCTSQTVQSYIAR